MIAKNATAKEFNSLVITQKQKQTNKQNIYMNIEFQNAIVGLCFLYRITNINIAWINPWFLVLNDNCTSNSCLVIVFSISLLPEFFELIVYHTKCPEENCYENCWRKFTVSWRKSFRSYHILVLHHIKFLFCQTSYWNGPSMSSISF